MVRLTIDGKAVSVQNGSTILQAAAAPELRFPPFVISRMSTRSAPARVCVVEVEGNENLCSACNTQAEEGMVVYTNSPKVRSARGINVELILSNHNTNCTSCVRNGNCTLQSLCRDLNITDIPFEVSYRKKNWDVTLPLIRDTEKCVKCMRCISFCEKVQGLGVWDVVGTGPRVRVSFRNVKSFADTNCAPLWPVYHPLPGGRPA